MERRAMRLRLSRGGVPHWGVSHFIRSYNCRTNLEASVLLINQSVLQGVRAIHLHIFDCGLWGRADTDD